VIEVVDVNLAVSPNFEKALKVPGKTLERWLKKLKEEDKIEFKWYIAP